VDGWVAIISSTVSIGASSTSVTSTSSGIDIDGALAIASSTLIFFAITGAATSLTSFPVETSIFFALAAFANSPEDNCLVTSLSKLSYTRFKFLGALESCKRTLISSRSAIEFANSGETFFTWSCVIPMIFKISI